MSARRRADLVRVRTRLGAIASASFARTLALTRALRGFARGFVGELALPRDRKHACTALTHRANGRGRCC